MGSPMGLMGEQICHPLLQLSARGLFSVQASHAQVLSCPAQVGPELLSLWFFPQCCG